MVGLTVGVPEPSVDMGMLIVSPAPLGRGWPSGISATLMVWDQSSIVTSGHVSLASVLIKLSALLN